jgi:hypothetical protein
MTARPKDLQDKKKAGPFEPAFINYTKINLSVL